MLEYILEYILLQIYLFSFYRQSDVDPPPRGNVSIKSQVARYKVLTTKLFIPLPVARNRVLTA